MTDTIWFPAYHQMRFLRNPNWLHSVWVGVFWPILCFWPFFVFNFIAPLTAAPSWKMLWYRTWATVVLHTKLPFFGLFGYVGTEDLTIEDMIARLMK